MNHLRSIILLGSLLALFSCQDEKNETPSYESFQKKTELKVLSERDPNYPLSLEKENKTQTRALIDEPNIVYYLGKAYNPTAVPIESPLNFSYRVIDLEKLDRETNYINKDLINASDQFSLSFSNFNSNSLTNYNRDKFTASSSFGYSGFEGTYKGEFEKKFTSITKNEETTVYGEGSIFYRATSYNIQSNSANIKRKISRSYMDSSFIEELYSQSLKSTVNNYGCGVLNRFISGGRVTAMYCGVHEENLNKTIAEQIMKNSINTSMKAGGAEVGFGTAWENESSETIENLKKFTTFQVAAKVQGGMPLGGAISASQDLFSFKLDLTPWVNSLSNRQNHSIAEIPDASIDYIYEFIEEENYKTIIKYHLIDKYRYTYDSRLIRSSFDTFMEPSIIIVLTASHLGEEPYINNNFNYSEEYAQTYLESLLTVENHRITATAYLQGRHGTCINIGNIKYIENTSIFYDYDNVLDKMNALRNEAANIVKNKFGLQVLSYDILIDIEAYYKYHENFTTPGFDNFIMPRFTENIRRKMIDQNKNLIYLLYENGNSKYAMSLFNSTRSINNYAFKFIDSISTIPFDSTLLEGYTIIGL